MTTKNSGKSVKIVKTQYGTIKVQQNTRKSTKRINKAEAGPSLDNKNGGGGFSVKDIFKVLADENGRVTSAKLRSFVRELGLEFSDDEVTEMIEVVAPGGKGEITYEGLVGIVRDFSHEFPSVELTPEEINRDSSTLTVSSTRTATTEASNETTQDNFSGKNTEIEETETESTASEHFKRKQEDETVKTSLLSRPVSSRTRTVLMPTKEKSKDKMSVIKEDEETETETENTKDAVNKANEKNNDVIKEDGKTYETETDIENINDTVNKADENNDDVSKEDVKMKEGFDDTSLEQDRVSNVITSEPEQPAESQTGGSGLPGEESEHKDTEEASESGIISKVQSEKSFVTEHRLDSAVSTSVSKFPQKKETEVNNGRQSRSKLVSEINLKSRKVSTQSTSGVVHRPSGIPGKDKNNNKLKPKTKIPEKPQPRKKLKAGDPEFYSAMGCSLKLSQIRIRQRLLFVMWRAVYDEAVRKAEQEHFREKTQKRKKTRGSIATK